MTKNEYLYILRKNLQILPQNEIDDIIQDVHEHFEFGLAEGKTEAEISRTLGDPIEMARQYTGGRIYEEPHHYEPKSDSSERVLTILVKIIIAFFLIGPVLAAYAILFGFFISGIVLAFVSIPLLFGGILPMITIPTFGLLALTSLGLLLLGVGTTWLTIYGFKGLNYLVKKFFQFNLGGNA
ncbi:MULTISPECIES: DUF1700 domain-containing protein [unclassified Erysipelothrix]|uniref:DUF1700 domain-containing protein n=1 Tax=unclassified Erysipelothrix TaxID=2624170 RepID=UPI0013777727|nr:MULTISPECIES: DUF1700 domain-containing protein [unclassified Erysipelothrix]MBK2402140.1 DUF1700 domain-containing protein [Erysipelothrix sp. strain 2 (EsS2-6-Brazil)]MBK2404560.1 DUF1700 domain-containing protein [Erysipelothrix sp. strain 2 (EsS2-7-Brazil)]NBA01176.1 DUF1700 domain-containing protein [Erysipelothrix rhusiopathiae]